MDSMGLLGGQILKEILPLIEKIRKLPTDSAVAVMNQIRQALHEAGPMRNEPVDCVLWVKAEVTRANDYNPNTVAPPEMRLLEHSIAEDGYTQPVVTWQDEEVLEVVDGFHRNRIGKESAQVRKRTHGYLTVTKVNTDRCDRGDRISSTIRHNRARGKHRIDAMSNIVIELKRRNWSDERIGRELGMDPDEVLRLSQISGLAEMFADRKFSEAWEADSINEVDDLATEEEVES